MAEKRLWRCRAQIQVLVKREETCSCSRKMGQALAAGTGTYGCTSSAALRYGTVLYTGT